MKAGVKNEFSQQFKDLILSQIPAIRSVFEQEMFSSSELDFGRRFYDDDRVLCEILSTISYVTQSKDREQQYIANPELLKVPIWQGLLSAAECDWYYSREKEY